MLGVDSRGLTSAFGWGVPWLFALAACANESASPVDMASSPSLSIEFDAQTTGLGVEPRDAGATISSADYACEPGGVPIAVAATGASADAAQTRSTGPSPDQRPSSD